MNIFSRLAAVSSTRFGKQVLVSLLSLAVSIAACPQKLWASQDAPAPVPAQDDQAGQTPPYSQQTPEQLQQLVAPIALYPDSLVAQILAASTFPEQVVEADRWVQAHSDLKGDDLGRSVDQQPWDPSVKALVAFPSVLGNMDKNLSWASSLGDAYYNQQEDVMNAVQVMRRRAQEAGNLKSTPQQTVATQDSDISIAPTNPEVVYVPAYDPWLAYGAPIDAWGGWYPYPGIWFGGPYLSFGMGFGIGWYGGFGWGWNNWGFNWRGGYGLYGGGRYYSRSNTFYNRNSYYRGGGERGVARNVQRGRTAPEADRMLAADLAESAAKRTPVPAQPAGLSTETGRQLEDTPHLAVRAASALVPLAATSMADRLEAFHHAEAPAWAAALVEEVPVVAGTPVVEVTAAGIGNRSVVACLIACKS